MPEPTIATAIATVAAKKLGDVAKNKLVAQIRNHDIGQQAEKYFTEVAERVAGVEDYRGLEPGLLTQLTLSTAKVDSEELRSYWVQLAFNGMTGRVADSEMRWAANVLERLVPADTVALALVLDRRVRMRRTGATRMPVVDAMNRLRVHGLIDFESHGGDGWSVSAPSFSSVTTNYEYVDGHRPGLVETIGWGTSGPGPKEHHVNLVQRWVLTDLGAKFAHICDVKPLDDHGELADMVVRMDAEFFANL